MKRKRAIITAGTIGLCSFVGLFIHDWQTGLCVLGAVTANYVSIRLAVDAKFISYELKKKISEELSERK